MDNRIAWLDLVDPAFRDEFLQFVETGEANEAFIQYMDANADCQKAVDMVFKEQSADFDQLFEKMKQNEIARHAASQTATRKMASAITSIRELPPEKRQEAVETVASLVTDPALPEQRKSYAQDLARVVAGSSSV